MALIWADGFDYLDGGATGSQIEAEMQRRYFNAELYYNSTWTSSVDTGQGGQGKSLKMKYYNQYIHKVWDTTYTELWMGWAVKFGVQDDNNLNYMATLRNTSNQNIGHLIIKNRFLMVSGGQSVPPVQHAIPNFHPNAWFYLEWYIKPGTGADGAYELRINGETIGSGSGYDFIYYPGPPDRCVFWCPTENPYDYWMDNLYVDDAGFYGPCIVRALHPDADGDDEQWTTSAGTDSYALVDDLSPPDDDTTYIVDSTTGNRTLFTYDNVPSGQTNIKAIQVATQARVEDATTYDLKNSLKQGGSIYNQSAVTVDGTTYTYTNIDQLDNDPDTASAWTESGVNSLQAGVEVG